MPISVLITGANDPSMLQEKIELAKSFSELDIDKIFQLIDSVAHLTDEAGVEFYKANNLKHSAKTSLNIKKENPNNTSK